MGYAEFPRSARSARRWSSAAIAAREFSRFTPILPPLPRRHDAATCLPLRRCRDTISYAFSSAIDAERRQFQPSVSRCHFLPLRLLLMTLPCHAIIFHAGARTQRRAFDDGCQDACPLPLFDA